MPDIDNDIFTIELNNLKAKCAENNWYAAIFAVKDSYELLVKYSCLTVASVIFNQDGTDDVFKVLTDPKRSMSFGDWTNDVVKIIRDSHFVKNDPVFSDFFKALVKLIGASQIVSWRNDTIGHGAMKFRADDQMISDIKEKRDAILDFAAAQNAAIQSIAAYNSEYHKAERAPFIIWEEGRALLFES